MSPAWVFYRVRYAWWFVRHKLPWMVSVWRFGREWDRGCRYDTRVHHRAWKHYQRTGELYVTDD